ncbi:DUF5330 domain-containing protein [Rhizobium sp. RU36D]|uniref:DUF5330 domain-containing protein n=1 Tax=Rhizobium sp. RU36D TaxID=1907415 RepID=UPI0009D7BACD|nr:DUF5330 domain-containing protein [Rhizobium sp. RU36D]SMC96923.1 hypothetical protein SAMN05880593_112124 [Rhizobium sp. RU36D]
MWFLIKGTFWFSMVLVLLSYFGKPEDTELAAAPGIEIGDAIAAATGAYSYIASICVEKPDVCVQGAETLQAIGQRAKAGALVAYQILDEKLAEGQPGEGAPLGQPPVGPATDDTVASAEGVGSLGDALSDEVVTGTVRQPLTITVHVPVPQPRPGS